MYKHVFWYTFQQELCEGHYSHHMTCSAYEYMLRHYTHSLALYNGGM